MKRILSLVIIICTVLTLASCGGSLKKESPVYRELRAMVGEEYSSLTIWITTETDGRRLQSSYTLTSDGDVTYTVERLTTFEEQDGAYVIPESYKETLRGSAHVENGTVTQQSGDEVELDLARICMPKPNFDSKYFADVKDKDGSFQAKVTNPTGFLGRAVSYTNMTLTVLYRETLPKMTISYTSKSGSSVIVQYQFEP